MKGNPTEWLIERFRTLHQKLDDLRNDVQVLKPGKVAELEATVKRLQEAYLPGNWEKLDEIAKARDAATERVSQLEVALKEAVHLWGFGGVYNGHKNDFERLKKLAAEVPRQEPEEDATFKRHLSEHQITSRDEPITAQEGHLGPHPNYDPKTSVSPYTEITSLAAEAATQACEHVWATLGGDSKSPHEKLCIKCEVRPCYAGKEAHDPYVSQRGLTYCRKCQARLDTSNDSHSMGCYEDRQSVWHCDAGCPIRSRISQEGQPK